MKTYVFHIQDRIIKNYSITQHVYDMWDLCGLDYEVLCGYRGENQYIESYFNGSVLKLGIL